MPNSRFAGMSGRNDALDSPFCLARPTQSRRRRRTSPPSTRARPCGIVVGFSSGGGYDHYARVLTRHIGRHIPGNPNVIVQNMPGAASLNSVKYLIRRRADRRHLHQRVQSRPDHAIADRAAEGRHQLPGLRLDRQHQRGLPRLPHLERHRHQDLAGLAGAAQGDRGQHRRRHLRLYRQPHPERPVRHEAATGDGLSRQRREAHRDRARRARRRLRLVDEHAGRMAARPEDHRPHPLFADAGPRHAGERARCARRC